MKDELTVILRRAAAEGYSLADIKSAAKRIEGRQLASLETGPKAGDGSITTISHLADRISRSTRYTGGFMYPGTMWSQGLERHQPKQSSKVGESTDGSPEAVIEAILEQMGLGTYITETVNYGNGIRTDTYVRVAEGFRHVEYSDESEDKFFADHVSATSQEVADELGVPHSATLVALHWECLGNFA